MPPPPTVRTHAESSYGGGDLAEGDLAEVTVEAAALSAWFDREATQPGSTQFERLVDCGHVDTLRYVVAFGKVERELDCESRWLYLSHPASEHNDCACTPLLRLSRGDPIESLRITPLRFWKDASEDARYNTVNQFLLQASTWLMRYIPEEAPQWEDDNQEEFARHLHNMAGSEPHLSLTDPRTVFCGCLSYPLTTRKATRPNHTVASTVRQLARVAPHLQLLVNGRLATHPETPTLLQLTADWLGVEETAVMKETARTPAKTPATNATGAAKAAKVKSKPRSLLSHLAEMAIRSTSKQTKRRTSTGAKGTGKRPRIATLPDDPRYCEIVKTKYINRPHDSDNCSHCQQVLREKGEMPGSHDPKWLCRLCNNFRARSRVLIVRHVEEGGCV